MNDISDPRNDPNGKYNGNEIVYVSQVLDSVNYKNQEPFTVRLEAAFAKKFGTEFAIAHNSGTTTLISCLAGVGVGANDEVICPAQAVAMNAASALALNATPVFADIDPNTFCISAETIRAKITPRTKAIIVVHIFGQTADMDPIMALAEEHGLIVIEDAAQCPFATYKGRRAGTLGHMGVFSLNYHKHVHTGEGGVVTTNDAGLAEKLCLIRNHAEAVVGKRGVRDLVNMVGFNFRMGEIEAAIGLCQLAKGPDLIRRRQANVAHLENRLAGIPGLTMPVVGDGNAHVYYVHAMTYDPMVMDLPRAIFLDALKAELPATELREGEGPLMGAGYVRPIYLEPMFQEQTAYGALGCPFACPHYKGEVNYGRGLCPETERAHFETLITHEMIRPPMTTTDLDDVANAVQKVVENLPALKDYSARTGAKSE